MWERNPWKDVKHTETALAQEIPQLQIAGDSVAVRMLKRAIIYACSAFILSSRDLLLVGLKSRVLCDMGLWTKVQLPYDQLSLLQEFLLSVSSPPRSNPFQGNT